MACQRTAAEVGFPDTVHSDGGAGRVGDDESIGPLRTRQPPAPESIVVPSWPPGFVTLRRTVSLAEKSSITSTQSGPVAGDSSGPRPAAAAEPVIVTSSAR